jgi:phenylalanine-4-hydroxylase
MKQSEDLYSTQDHKIWSLLTEKLNGAYEKTNMEFKVGLRQIKLPTHYIPTFAELNNVLRPYTGWSYQASEEVASNFKFLHALSNKIFLASSKIRSLEEFEFCKLPDIFHDVYGHAAMLVDNQFSDFLVGLGNIACKFKDHDEAISNLASIYWYTAEVGLVYEGGKLHYYGGSIISSLSEIATVYSSSADILPYSVKEVMNTSYNSYDVNSKYFYLNNLSELNESLKEIENVLEMRYPKDFVEPKI